MKHLEEYRDGAAAARLAAEIAARTTRGWTLMEVCGGQTFSILRFGIDGLLPERITLVHGPGCPVCVTPVELVDKAVAIALEPGAALATFGDMARVPGSGRSPLDARADGADVRVVYSPLDALAIARAEPEREVVFFAVGFETTAPANAMAVRQAAAEGLANFSILSAQVLVPPALEAILADPECAIDGFLAPGHVCAVMGTAEYEEIARRHDLPIVVTGFEPVDILDGALRCVTRLEEGRPGVENAYARAVRPGGNPAARAAIAEVFRPCPRRWRGMDEIPASGLALREEYAAYDAERRFDLDVGPGSEAPTCIAGAVLRGLARPPDCPEFGTGCTPDRPLGAPMVSSEGACAAYWRYRREGS